MALVDAVLQWAREVDWEKVTYEMWLEKMNGFTEAHKGGKYAELKAKGIEGVDMDEALKESDTCAARASRVWLAQDSHPFIHSVIVSFMHPSIHPSIPPFSHSFIHSFILSFFHSFIYGCIHPCISSWTISMFGGQGAFPISVMHINKKS